MQTECREWDSRRFEPCIQRLGRRDEQNPRVRSQHSKDAAEFGRKGLCPTKRAAPVYGGEQLLDLLALSTQTLPTRSDEKKCAEPESHRAQRLECCSGGAA